MWQGRRRWVAYGGGSQIAEGGRSCEHSFFHAVWGTFAARCYTLIHTTFRIEALSRYVSAHPCSSVSKHDLMDVRCYTL